MSEKKLYITLSKVKERGWTSGLIEKFLGLPDSTAKNPHYSKRPIKLFLLERVEAIENTDSFKEKISKMEKQRESSRERMLIASNDKRKLLIEYIQSLKIKIKKIDYPNLLKKAIDNYNDHNGYSGQIANKDSDKKFLDRIRVNYIRHCCTRYDNELENMFGKVGKNEGYVLLKCRILDVISKTYPYLYDECCRQKDMLSSTIEVPNV